MSFPDHLTRREIDVLRLIARGEDNQSIAALLVLSCAHGGAPYLEYLRQNWRGGRGESGDGDCVCIAPQFELTRRPVGPLHITFKTYVSSRASNYVRAPMRLALRDATLMHMSRSRGSTNPDSPVTRSTSAIAALLNHGKESGDVREV